MTSYTVHTWSDGDPQHIDRFHPLAERKTLRGARAYARRHADRYDGGLYIRYPDGTVDTGRELLDRHGNVIRTI